MNFMLADMAIGIETSRLAVQRSAWEVDQVSCLLASSNVLSTRWKLLFATCLFLVSSLRHYSGAWGYVVLRVSDWLSGSTEESTELTLKWMSLMRIKAKSFLYISVFMKCNNYTAWSILVLRYTLSLLSLKNTSAPLLQDVAKKIHHRLN